jgi:hypothetical protein
MEKGSMTDENTKQAAQEYLAAKLVEEEQSNEEKLNHSAAVACAPQLWKSLKEAVSAQCTEWNAVTQEQTLTCRETPIGDFRVWCAPKSKQMTLHYDVKNLLITVKNTARPEHEKDVILRIEGFGIGSPREARLIRNDQPVNLPRFILAELRILAGMTRQRNA